MSSHNAFAAYIAPAGAYPQLWRLLLGVAIIVGGFVGVAFAIMTLLYSDAVRTWIWSLPDPRLAEDFVLLTLVASLGLFAMVVVRLLHRRPAGTLFGPTGKTVRHALVATAVVGLIASASLLIPSSAEMELRQQQPPAAWAMFALLAVPFIVAQCTAEELVFRGYLVQQLAARFRSPSVFVLVPCVLFAAAHFDPTFGLKTAGLLVSTTFLYGLLLADITARTGSLGAAIGMHVGNNLVAFLSVSYGGQETALAAYHSDASLADPAIHRETALYGCAQILLAWAILVRLLGGSRSRSASPV